MTKPYIFMTRFVTDEVVDLLKKSYTVDVWNGDKPIPKDILIEKAKKADAILSMLTDKIDKEVMEQANKLKVISNMAVGYDNIDIEFASEKGILVTNTPGILSETTADLTFALLMATARRICEANRYVLEGNWNSWSPMLLTGQDIFGSTLGIIGMGRIGEAVAKRAKGFNMNVLYYNRNRKTDIEKELGVKYQDFDELLKESDYVILLTPATPETKDLIGEREFSIMKPSASFINVSRGVNVDEEALYNALVNKEIWAAGLDVFKQEPIALDNPLLKLDNVVVLPHIGSASIKTRERMALMAAQNIKDILMGSKSPNIIN